MVNLGIDDARIAYTGDSAYYVTENEMTKEETSTILDEIIQEAGEDDIPEVSEEAESMVVEESVDDMIARLETQRRSGIIDEETYRTQKEKLEARRPNEASHEEVQDMIQKEKEQKERAAHPYKTAAKDAKNAITDKINGIRNIIATESEEIEHGD